MIPAAFIPLIVQVASKVIDLAFRAAEKKQSSVKQDVYKKVTEKAPNVKTNAQEWHYEDE